MADILADGLAFLTDQLGQYASEPITYGRGADSVDVDAVIQLQMLRLDDGDGGIRIEFTDLTACVPTAALSFDGTTLVEPRRGDLIHRITAYDSETFEVLPYGPGESCWRWSDPVGHTMRRIHAKRIDTRQFS